MFKILLIFSISFTIFSNCSGIKPDKLTRKQCENKIFRECTHECRFTAKEIDNARIYLQQRFAITNPKIKPCDKLQVRKEIKCLTPKELEKFIAAFSKLYSRGVIDKFTEIHATHWPGTHKFTESIPWHRWFVNELQKEIFKIDPTVVMPYWDYMKEFSAPEKSIIFDIFGHAGKKEDDFCVTDGAFPYQQVNYPKPHCLRRQWNRNGTIPNWEPLEFYTSLKQIYALPSFLRPERRTLLRYGKHLKTVIDLLDFLRTIGPTSQPFSQYCIIHAYVCHFKTHLNLGGYAGDMSIPIATNDVLFYLMHEFTHYNMLKWQLSRDDYLVPRSYNLGIRLDEDTQEIVGSDISDNLTYYKNIPVADTFLVGYGDQCYIYDQLVRPINQLMNKETIPEPEAIRRLRNSLPTQIFAKYYPRFHFSNESESIFDSILPDVGHCNPKPVCKPMPIAPKFTDTDNGRRQYKAFIEDANFDITQFVVPAEEYYYQFMDDLNKVYCSPYVI
jgi:hypothetical protein